MKHTLKTIKEACFINGCTREVSNEILGLEKELKEDSYCIIDRQIALFKREYPHRLFTCGDVHHILAELIKEFLGE